MRTKLLLTFTYAWLSVLLAGYLGYVGQHSLSTAYQYGFSCLVLGLLEVSMSFDNAVVNANILETMEEKWRNYFLIIGMPIAVIVMRGVFPTAVISLAMATDPITAIKIALVDPVRYQAAMESSQPQLMAFGAGFLIPVALAFFLDKEKDTYWLSYPEKIIQKLPASGIYVYTYLAIAVVSLFTLHKDHLLFHDLTGLFLHVFIGGALGMITHMAVEMIGDKVAPDSDLPMGVAKVGVSGFIYLEMIDASMSFDGVIGAFAITTNPAVIALGLGIGAASVRTLTLLMVKYKTLSTYKYLDHGAFWAILVLVTCMLLSVVMHIPESLTGIVGAVLISAAFLTSVISNRRST